MTAPSVGGHWCAIEVRAPSVPDKTWVAHFLLLPRRFLLAGRPAQVAATQQMQVQVENGLAGPAATVNYGAIAGE